MNDTLLTETVAAANEIMSKSDTSISSANYWMGVAIFELLIIIYLLFLRKKPESARDRFKEEAKKGDIDFGNIINSSFHVKPLYDQLKIKCHPDIFPDKEKNEIALKLFQEISHNKTNYKKLIELKELAKQKLNINF